MGSAGDAFVIAEWRGCGRSAGNGSRALLRVQVGKDEVEAGEGSGVFVPGGTPHTYWSAHGLIQEIHGMQERTPAALRRSVGRGD